MSLEEGDKSIKILMVEDNLGYVRLTQEALKDAHLQVALSVVKDGVEALAFLRREGEYVNAPAPDLILLDLYMPRKTGHEVLAEIKADQSMKRVPVIVLTHSQITEDITSAYHLQASYFFTKPDDLEQFGHVVKLIRTVLAKRGESPTQ